MRMFLARVGNDAGQAIVFIAVILTALCGMAALVVDVGSWYQADRRLQTAADAAALAGAQELPLRQSTAKSTADQYAQHNYPGIATPTVTFPDAGTIDVVAKADTPGIFAKVLNDAFGVVTVHAEAQAAVRAPELMKNVAPIAVKSTVACIVKNPNCFGQRLTVAFDESQISSSAIGLIDLRCQAASSSVSCGGGPGGSTLADWIDNGYGSALPSNTWYDVKTGQTVGPIDHALNDAANAGRALFFPVFDQADGPNSAFHVIGWAAFVIDRGGVNWGSQVKKLTGHFVTFIATSLAAGNTLPSPDQDFGVHVITLTK
jgi:Putative Flp pilus-assembly TadE/G-like